MVYPDGKKVIGQYGGFGDTKKTDLRYLCIYIFEASLFLGWLIHGLRVCDVHYNLLWSISGIYKNKNKKNKK